MKLKAFLNSFFWMLFGAGGFVSAFALPVVFALLIASIGLGILDIFNFNWMMNFLDNPLNKLALLGVIVLSAWHSCHRIYHSLHDFGIHAGVGFMVVIYGLAAVISVLAVFLIFVS